MRSWRAGRPPPCPPATSAAADSSHDPEAETACARPRRSFPVTRPLPTAQRPIPRDGVPATLPWSSATQAPRCMRCFDLGASPRSLDDPPWSAACSRNQGRPHHPASQGPSPLPDLVLEGGFAQPLTAGPALSTHCPRLTAAIAPPKGSSPTPMHDQRSGQES